MWRRGPLLVQRRLDERDVETITAFLFHGGGHDDPNASCRQRGKKLRG